MIFCFLDESGTSDCSDPQVIAQPYYVLACVCIDARQLPAAYLATRSFVAGLNLRTQSTPLGLGFEIKAKDIASGTGIWRNQEPQRNAVRDQFLTVPRRFGGSAICVVIDKQALVVRNRKRKPVSPTEVAHKLMMERISKHLHRLSNDAFCVFDNDKRMEERVRENTSALLREGSRVSYWDNSVSDFVSSVQRIDRILDCVMGDSAHSIGLQVADFFATMTYQYYKQGSPANCGWWNTLKASLQTVGGRLHGYGLKEFPSATELMAFSAGSTG